LNRVAPQLLMEGRPARGGGRAAGSETAVDVTRLAALAPALQRRLLRQAAARLGAALDYPATEALRKLAMEKPAGQKLHPAPRLFAERTPRELRLSAAETVAFPGPLAEIPEYCVQIPGEIEATGFGLRLRVAIADIGGQGESNRPAAILRNWKPGDRVWLRHSGGPRKVKEVLERMRVTGTARALWPVLEWGGKIVWMQGVEVEPESGLTITAEAFAAGF
jgi:tRNA(Ile)-lysidine synthase